LTRNDVANEVAAATIGDQKDGARVRGAAIRGGRDHGRVKCSSCRSAGRHRAKARPRIRLRTRWPILRAQFPGFLATQYRLLAARIGVNRPRREACWIERPGSGDYPRRRRTAYRPWILARRTRTCSNSISSVAQTLATSRKEFVVQVGLESPGASYFRHASPAGSRGRPAVPSTPCTASIQPERNGRAQVIDDFRH